MSIKKAWISPFATNDELCTIGLESLSPEIEYQRISVESAVFPNNPTPTSPLRHCVYIRLMDLADLMVLREVIDSYINARVSADVKAAL